MAVILDAVVIAIVLLNIMVGYKKGLVKVAIQLIGIILAVIFALIFYKPVTDIVVENTGIDDSIESFIIQKGSAKNSDLSENDSVSKYMENKLSETAASIQNGVVESASHELTIKIINIASMIIIFIVVRLLALLICLVSSFVTRLPFIKQFNKIGGIIYGILKGFLIVYILLAILFFIVYALGNESILLWLEGSSITKLLYNNNIILNILFK